MSLTEEVERSTSPLGKNNNNFIECLVLAVALPVFTWKLRICEQMPVPTPPPRSLTDLRAHYMQRSIREAPYT